MDCKLVPPILLIQDVFVEVCENLDKMSDLLKCERLSTFHKNIIRQTYWRRIPCHLVDFDMFETIIDRQYQFGNLHFVLVASMPDIGKIKNICDAKQVCMLSKIERLETLSEKIVVHLLQGCTHSSLIGLYQLRELDLGLSNIKDSTLIQILQSCPHLYTIDLFACENITDLSIGEIPNHRNIRSIELEDTMVTNKSIRLLGHLEKLGLGCTAVTDDGLSFLSGVKTLNLVRTDITDDGLGFLHAVQFITLSECKDISDVGVSKLIACRVLGLASCPKIRGLFMKDLHSVSNLDVSDCRNLNPSNLVKDLDVDRVYELRGLNLAQTRVSNNQLQSIVGSFGKISAINLGRCHNINDDGIQHLKYCADINLIGCSDITPKGLSYLTRCIRLNIRGCIRLNIRGCCRIDSDFVLGLIERGVDVVV